MQYQGQASHCYGNHTWQTFEWMVKLKRGIVDIQICLTVIIVIDTSSVWGCY